MYRIIAIGLLSLATVANADQPKITETSDSIIVEYTGTQPDKAGESGLPVAAPNANPKPVPRVESLNAQLERLKREVDELSILTGKETEEELRTINELTSQKKQQIERLSAEISKSAESEPKKSSEIAKPDNEQQQTNQQTRRQEMKKGVRDMQQMRRSTIFPGN